MSTLVAGTSPSGRCASLGAPNVERVGARPLRSSRRELWSRGSFASSAVKSPDRWAMSKASPGSESGLLRWARGHGSLLSLRRRSRARRAAQAGDDDRPGARQRHRICPTPSVGAPPRADRLRRPRLPARGGRPRRRDPDQRQEEAPRAPGPRRPHHARQGPARLQHVHRARRAERAERTTAKQRPARASPACGGSTPSASG